MPWQCPRCGRSFGRTGQQHSCGRPPGLPEWLSGRPPQVGGVLDVVRAHLDQLGDDVLVEPVRSAVMIKRARTFAELRPRRQMIELSFIVSRRIEHPRILRTLDLTSRRTVHVLAVTGPADVDGPVRDWLTEAYMASPVRP